MSKRLLAVPQDGYLRDWLLLGPFGGSPSGMLDRSLIPATTALPAPGQAAAGRKWTRCIAPHRTMNLLALGLGKEIDTQCGAYAHVYVHSAQEALAVLALGSDDGVAVWLNADLVYRIDTQRGVLPDQDRVCVNLRAGWNRLLILITQYVGEWGFCARFLSATGTPLRGLAYSVDRPVDLRRTETSRQAFPLTLCLGVPESGSIGMTLINVSRRTVPSGQVVIRGEGDRVIAQRQVLALEAGMRTGVEVALTPEQWRQACRQPIRVRVLAGGRPASVTGEIAPGFAASFDAAAAVPPAGLAPAQRKRLARLREELRHAPDIAEDRADAAPWLEALTHALLDDDAEAAGQALTKLDTIFEAGVAAMAHQAVYLVGHAHIDMNWLWRWPETVQVCQDTFRQAIRFMKEFPDFRFTQSQASCYEAVEQYDPLLFARIREAVRQGKWNLVGGMWTESDTNLSSGEALARSFLLAQRYFQEKFGVRARVGWLPDCFGHTAQLPQLLRSAGIEYFYHMRTGPSGAQLYWWEGPDGSRVLTKTGQGYNDRVTPAIRHQPEKLPVAIGRQMFVYGVGDHGGGPTRRDIVTAKAYGQSRLFPRMRFASADEYFDDVKPHAKGLPLHRGELQYIFEGCYTNISTIKKGNRDLENALQSAEAVATAARLTGQPWPAAPLAAAWKTLVFNEFHDILPGSAIHESNDDSRARYFHAITLATETRARALRAVAEQIRITRSDAIPLVVFNTLAWKRTEVVEAELVVTDAFDGMRVTDGDGHEIAAQVVRTKQFDADIHAWVRFVAPAVPALGYRTFWVEPVAGGRSLAVSAWGNYYAEEVSLPAIASSIPKAQRVSRKGWTIRNRFCEAAFDAKDGAITSLKLVRRGKTGANLIGKAGGNRLQMYLEQPHGMSAWNLDSAPKGPVRVEPAGRPHIVQEGPESVVVRTEYAWGRSRFWLTTTVHSDSPRIDCRLRADWLEKGTDKTDSPMLRVHFAVAGKPEKLACDVPFAVVDRPAGREVPAQKWVDVALGADGLALMNTGKYGHSLVDGVLRLTLLRSSYDPDIHPDLGRHEIAWSLLPHAGHWQKAGLPRAGMSYNVPLEGFQARPQKGRLPLQQSFVGAEGDPAFVVTGVKQAEDGRALILRGYNASNREIPVAITAAHSIRSARRDSILEEPAAAGKVSVNAGKAVFKARPWEIVTLRLR